jgi:glutamate dehydrogenase (NADP+)
MRFCQSFITELYRHIGENTDVPGGDIGVGQREIGYMFGQYKRITNSTRLAPLQAKRSAGARPRFASSLGYGCAYFMQEVLGSLDDTFEGKTCLVSGSAT